MTTPQPTINPMDANFTCECNQRSPHVWDQDTCCVATKIQLKSIEKSQYKSGMKDPSVVALVKLMERALTTNDACKYDYEWSEAWIDNLYQEFKEALAQYLQATREEWK